MIDRIKKFVEKYRVQVYGIVLVVAVGLFVYLIVWAFTRVREEQAQEFAALTRPDFGVPLATVTGYDLSGVSWEEEMAKAYKLDSNITSKVVNAAGRLGIEGEMLENRYREYYYWEDDDETLVFYYKSGRVDYEGEADLVWANNEAIKNGISELFGVNSEGLVYETELITGSGSIKQFNMEIDGKSAHFSLSGPVLSVNVDSEGRVKEFGFYIVDAIDSSKVRLLSKDKVKTNILDLPSGTTADVGLPDTNCGGENCYLDTIMDPKGKFTANAAEIALYKSGQDQIFLVPVLELSGTMTTEEGYTGDATVLVDIVDWESVQ